MAAAALLTVSVAWSAAPGEADEVTFELPEGATVRQALQRSGVLERHPGIDPARHPVGVWGRRCEPDRVLRDLDRVEVYRALMADPMEARRVRQREQSAQVAKRPAR